MDQKLLLKEKDYELLQTKRTVPTRHSFRDPLLNPPKFKPKKNNKQRPAPELVPNK